MKKVLIADDDEVLIKVLEVGLKKYHDHFEPIFVPNGLEAINVLNAQPIDVVVTDIQMPMMDGLVLLAFMREGFPNLPCIIMTAYGTPQLKEQLKKDVLHFIDKPVRADKLGEMIRLALDRKPSDARNRIAIADLLNLIMMGGKTCIFKLKTRDAKSGYFYFHEGDLFNAVWEKSRGEEAVLKMLEYEDAELTFTKAPQAKGEKQIHKDLSELISLAKSSRLSVQTPRRTP